VVGQLSIFECVGLWNRERGRALAFFERGLSFAGGGAAFPAMSRALNLKRVYCSSFTEYQSTGFHVVHVSDYRIAAESEIRYGGSLRKVFDRC
jgi:hypothetical protein